MRKPKPFSEFSELFEFALYDLGMDLMKLLTKQSKKQLFIEDHLEENIERSEEVAEDLNQIFL